MTQGYQEICFALRHGALIKRKATMSYYAHVVKCASDPNKVEVFEVAPIQAVNEREAAQHAALVVARRLFQNGEVSFFQDAGDRFLAAAGNYHFANGHGINVGVSLSIRIEQE